MKTTMLIAAALLYVGIVDAQFGRGQQVEPLPEGSKPASTNTFK